MSKFPIVTQHDERDCGAACLSMICEYFGAKYKLATIREAIKVDNKGANIYGIVQGSIQLGLNGNPLSGSPDDIIVSIANKEVTFPFIARIITEDMFEHFIVVYAIRGNKMVVGDPAKNRITNLPIKAFFQQWQGQIIVFKPNDSFVKVNARKGTLLKYFRFITKQKKMIIYVFIASVLISTINVSGSLIFDYILTDSVTMNKTNENSAVEELSNSSNNNETKKHSLESESDNTIEKKTTASVHEHEENLQSDKYNKFYHNLSKVDGKLSIVFKNINTICITIILMYILRAIISMLRGYLLATTTKKIDIPITYLYYDHLMELKPDFFHSRSTGELMSRFNDTANIRNAISTTTLTIMLDTIMALACGILLGYINLTLFSITLGILCIYLIVILFFRIPIRNINYKAMEAEARVTSYLKETIDGIDTIKEYNSIKSVQNKLHKKYEKYVSANVRGSIIYNNQNSIVTAITSIGTVVLLWAGTYLCLQDVITIVDLFIFYYIMEYFTTPISNLINIQPLLQTAIVAAERLDDIVEAEKESEIGEKLECINDNIHINHINFRYGNRDLVLNDLSMVFKKGKKTAIVGESGCGKTTIAKLLLSMHHVEKGNILIGDTPMNIYSPQSIRERIAYVPQDIFFFSDSVYNNLTGFDKSITLKQVVEVCKICQVDDFIQKLPNGYNTNLEENAFDLSAGQRQRIAIARALLRKPDVLILDEATSNLDTITEMNIRKTIDNLSNQITCIIIAHRMNTIRNCDYIYVMENGQVFEEGSHDYLMEHSNLYRNYIECNC